MVITAMLKTYLKGKELLSNNKGQAMTEYGLIIALIAVTVIVALGAISGRLGIAFQKIVSALPSS